MLVLFTSPSNVDEICGTFRNCEGRDDGRYPDIDRNCRYYFTCYAGKFMGHNPCPAGLVFNYALQTCDYITDIGPPCGINPNMTSNPLEQLEWTPHQLITIIKKNIKILLVIQSAVIICIQYVLLIYFEDITRMHLLKRWTCVSLQWFLSCYNMTYYSSGVLC